MENFTHIYCDICKTIRPVMRHELKGTDVSGKFVCTDLLCRECVSIVTTVFKPLHDERPQTDILNIPSFDSPIPK